MISCPDILMTAIAFAARAHRNQNRKDGVTPYVSHVLRVMAVVSEVFDVHDVKVLAAAVLHDTIEDTTTDYDDLHEAFGVEVADWVATLTKDMRLPEAERERRYIDALISAPWPVTIIKLADIYDNLGDAKSLDVTAQQRQFQRARAYLLALSTTLPPQARTAVAIVEARLKD
jgi:guanosine-3',5'-bis(diphosphate) 3'-pyrophosphohydrolase